MKTLNPQELLRYQRHTSLPLVGEEGQQRLKEAKVLCIGAGGLGSPVLLYLAAAGIGTLGIVDDDAVDLSNLQRQVLYSENNVGSKKTDSAIEKLKDLNSHIILKNHPLRLNAENCIEIICEYDVIVDGTDNFKTRYLLNDVCLSLSKPLIWASIFQFQGQCSVVLPKESACFRCIFPEPPSTDLSPSCSEAGVLGVLPGIMGSIQATEVIKIILGIGSPLQNRLLCFEALSMRFNEVSLERDPYCKSCSINNLVIEETKTMGDEISVQTLKSMRDKGESFLLLDVREQNEYDTCHLDGLLMPISDVPNRYSELDPEQHIVVHCKLGGRSRKVVDFLKDAGFHHVKNLTGGIIAWIDDIDPSMTKY